MIRFRLRDLQIVAADRVRRGKVRNDDNIGDFPEICLHHLPQPVPVHGIRCCGRGKGVLVGNECVSDPKGGIHRVGNKNIHPLPLKQLPGITVRVQKRCRNTFGEPEGFCKAEESFISAECNLTADLVNREPLLLNKIVGFSVRGKRTGVAMLFKICCKLC